MLAMNGRIRVNELIILMGGEESMKGIKGTDHVAKKKLRASSLDIKVSFLESKEK